MMMSEHAESTAESGENVPENLDLSALPDDLPPVEPPSAGFIVQLFVVPALIVMAVIGVWLLFGQLASSDQDLSRVLADLKSDNIHRQWRAAFSLAQILEADAQKGDQGEHLATSPTLASDLAALLREQLKQTTPSLEDLQKQSYLTRSLGWFDLPDAVFPALSEAMNQEVTAAEGSPERELQSELKTTALTSIAMIAGRAWEKQSPIGEKNYLVEMDNLAGDPDPRIRRMTAFTMSFFTGQSAAARLQSMLVDADEMTRLNAAVGLTRAGSTAGFPVLKSYLETSVSEESLASENALSEHSTGELDENNKKQIAEFEHHVALKNVIKAVGSLGKSLSDEQRSDAILLISPLAKGHPIPEIHQVAIESLKQLNAQGDN